MNGWMQNAACKDEDPEFWFPEYDKKDRAVYYAKIDYAVATCGSCSVQKDCLEWALTTETDLGIFGGLLPEERKKLL